MIRIQPLGAGERHHQLGQGARVLRKAATPRLELRKMPVVQGDHGRDRFPAQYLRKANLDWAADLLGEFVDIEGATQ